MGRRKISTIKYMQLQNVDIVHFVTKHKHKKIHYLWFLRLHYHSHYSGDEI